MNQHTAVSNKGVKVTTFVGGTPPIVRFGTKSVDIPVNGMFTRAATFEGEDFAIMKAATGNATFIVSEQGMVWELGENHGNQPCAIRVVGGNLLAAVVKANTGGAIFGVTCEVFTFNPTLREWNKTASHVRANTSVGILELDPNGLPRWTDDNDWVEIQGFTLRHAQIVGNYFIGLDQHQDRTLAVGNGEAFVVHTGHLHGLHSVSVVLEDGQIATALSLPYDAVVMQVDWQEIVPSPPPEPPETWPRKLWTSSFFGVSTQYGNTTDHVGNAVTIVEATSIGDGIDTNMPLVVAPNGIAITPAVQDRTIAWWTSATNVDDLGVSVQRYQADLVEKPVVAYLDNDQWPASRPSWVDERVWPSVQVYRFPNEALGTFKARTEGVVQRVASYGRPIWLTIRMDDFNHEGSVQQTIEAIEHYIDLTNRYFVVGLHMFADRRPGGMEDNPELRYWGHVFQAANPAERPNRFDYWQPEGTDFETILRNKLGQTTPNIALSDAEKAFILALLDGEEPEPPPNTTPIEQVLALMMQKRAALPTLLSADECVGLMNATLLEVHGWGLLRKESGNYGELPDGTRCSVDFIVRRDDLLGFDVLRDAGNRDTRPGEAQVLLGNSELFPPDRFVEPLT